MDDFLMDPNINIIFNSANIQDIFNMGQPPIARYSIINSIALSLNNISCWPLSIGGIKRKHPATIP